MRTLLTSFLLICVMTVRAKEEPRYPVSAIPEELKKGAYAVVREDEMVFTINSKSSASLHVHMVVTIFNGNGQHFAKKAVFYDKLRKVTSLKAQVFDSRGVLIKRLKPSEITDHSAFEGLYDDSRVKVANLTQGNYPYTVEFEYDVAYKFLYHIAGSAIDPYEDVSIEHASYKLVFPESLKPRYKTYNVIQEARHEKNNDIVSLTWSFENFKARKFEPYSDHMKAITRIEAAPTIFEFEGYAGTMNSWNEYGKWIASLNKGRNNLPEETKQKVRSLTENLSTTEEKVKVLYEYMQDKTRYVSIQLGIGGFQPFEASVVDKTGYGDCKALSNYMVSMLEAINIKSHYTLIWAGENTPELEDDFPNSQFNHAIVAVPNGTDTLWLECTSQTNPFGYQGRFTGDRKALLVTDQGAKIVNTLEYPAEVNIQATLADVTVGHSGDAVASVKRSYSGLQYENGGLHVHLNGQYDQQKKWLQHYLDIPSFNIESFSMKNVKEKIPSAIVMADLRIDRFATLSGKRMFLTPNLMNRSSSVPEKNENRVTDIVSKFAFTDIDTIRYHLPEEIYPEFLPEDVTINSVFGEYEAQFKVQQGNLVYIRKLTVNKGNFPPAAYDEMVAFYRNISKADNTKMVFMSKT